MTSWSSGIWPGLGAIRFAHGHASSVGNSNIPKTTENGSLVQDAAAGHRNSPGKKRTGTDLFEDDEALPGNPFSSLLIGFITLIMAVIVFAVWSTLAPIATATIATGTVVVENNHRTIQHQDGGTIEKINVQDGSVVHAGDVLMELDGDKLRADQQITRELYVAKALLAARLVAERNNSNDIVVPDEIQRLSPQYAAKALEMQKRLMVSRRQALRARINVTQSEQRQAEEDLNGLSHQIESQKTRLDLTEVELAGAQTLARSGAGTQQRVLEVSRGRADLEGTLASMQSRAAEAQLRVDHGAAQIAQTMATFYESIETDATSTERELLETKQRLQALDQQIARLRILAPVDGTVVSLAVHTIGGVAVAGSPLMEIVPNNEKLVIETQIKPEDVEAVHKGDPVDIRVGGTDAREMRRLTGHVASISGDRLTDRFKGLSFFILRVEVDPDELKAATGRQLRPGMTVDLFVFKGQQTILQYLAAPLTSFFNKGLRQ